jgi:hypothetical protein
MAVIFVYAYKKYYTIKSPLCDVCDSKPVIKFLWGDWFDLLGIGHEVNVVYFPVFIRVNGH